MGLKGPFAAIAGRKKGGPPITATGAFTTSTYEGRKFFTFTGTGTVIVNTPVEVDYIAIGGGGSGGGGDGGGGGAGGLQQATGLTLTPGTHTITIGSGGLRDAASGRGTSGGSTIFGSIATANGGGAGGQYTALALVGGCGGGGSYNNAGSAGNQGVAGGASTTLGGNGGGGGGVNGIGATGTATSGSGTGGMGITYNNGTILELGGGGGGGGGNGLQTGGSGTFGGGTGGTGVNAVLATAGTTNSGGGGGGGGGQSGVGNGLGANGGSGIFIISYPIFTFTPTGTITWPSGTFLPKTASILTGPTSYYTSLTGVSCMMGGGFIGTPIAGSLVTPDINAAVWYAYAKDSSGYIRIARFGVSVSDRVVSATAYDSKYYLDAGTAISASTVVGLYATATNAGYATSSVGIYGLVFTTLDSYVSRMVNGVRYYKFLTSGSITTTEAVVMDYFAIGGGGGGATNGSGGGGAGGLHQGFTVVPTGQYNLTVGNGGQGTYFAPTSGFATVLSGTAINAAGGGAGGQDVSGTTGGCGGGTGYNRGNGNSGGVGTQGFNGGGNTAGGGGGLSQAGADGGAGAGGRGITYNGEQYGGGGGGGSTNSNGGGASHGGGAGGTMDGSQIGSNATPNTGGGGGSGINKFGISYAGGNGGSGVFICSFFTPTSIAGCTVWLDANDVNGDGLDVADGTTVVKWTNKSPGGTDATGVGSPMLKKRAVNGQSGVELNGTSQWFNGSTANTGNEQTTAFAVATMNGAGSNRRLLGLYLPGTTDGTGLSGMIAFLQNGTGTAVTSYRNGAFVGSAGAGTVTTGIPFMASTIASSSGISTRINGSVTATATTTGTFMFNRYGIGYEAVNNTASDRWSGCISEILIFKSTALSDYNRLRVETYLASKYSIAASPLAFAFTGADQLVVVPPGITTARVYLWGAGGGNGTSDRAGENPYAGGAGAMLQGMMAVTAGETLTVMVGEGGGQLKRTTYGGGGAASNVYGSGGGRSAIRRGGVDVVTAGAGGGGGNQRPDYYEGTSFGGSATFSGTANNGYATTGYGQAYAFGGSQTAGGARGANTIYGTAFDGGFNYGGAGVNGGSGGGSGYYGGGGSSWGYGDMSGAGGGGSSFTTNLTLIPGETVLGYNSSNQRLPPAAFSPWYESGVATRGGHGRVVIIF